ncbi:MAG: hypothetical protein E5V56_02825, partial [Mesorhizobium sp.]
ADPLVCASFPLGTHFLWHILNGLMLGVLLAAVARQGAPKGRGIGECGSKEAGNRVKLGQTA